MTLWSAAASAVVLPSGPCNGQNCLQFSDFSVYSLTLLNVQAGGDGALPQWRGGETAWVQPLEVGTPRKVAKPGTHRPDGRGADGPGPGAPPGG